MKKFDLGIITFDICSKCGKTTNMYSDGMLLYRDDKHACGKTAAEQQKEIDDFEGGK